MPIDGPMTFPAFRAHGLRERAGGRGLVLAAADSKMPSVQLFASGLQLRGPRLPVLGICKSFRQKRRVRRLQPDRAASHGPGASLGRRHMALHATAACHRATSARSCGSHGCRPCFFSGRWKEISPLHPPDSPRTVFHSRCCLSTTTLTHAAPSPPMAGGWNSLIRLFSIWRDCRGRPAGTASRAALKSLGSVIAAVPQARQWYRRSG
jgi:hypothetical protein